MLTFLFQLSVYQNNPYASYGDTSGVDNTGFIALFIIFGALALFVAILYIIRSILHSKNSLEKSLDRVVLQIMVPKERKSEGQGGQAGGDDRLEQVREEIGITETFFSAIAALKPQKGFSRWLSGRDDHVSFEIVVHDGLIYFYIDTPKRFEGFMEQQVHAQYPNAQIEQMIDYNIFRENSKIAACYLSGSSHKSFPFRTYKKMDSDPLSGLLNAVAKIQENNSSAIIQFVVRSAKKKWRRKTVKLVREIKKGKKFEHVAAQSMAGKFFRKTMDIAEETFKEKKKDDINGQHHYQLSQMEEEMVKGIEEKMSKGLLEVTTRLVSVSDSSEVAKMNLDNIANSFGQYAIYRYGNTFHATVPSNPTKIIRESIYRTFSENRYSIMNTEEMASLWHLPLHSTEAPRIKWLSGRRAPPPANLPNSGLLLGHVPYRGVDSKVFMKEADRRRHLYVIGKSGTGKSVLLANLAIQDIQNGHGVCVVDPHGDLIEDILIHVPKSRADDVVIFNPSDLERPIGLNMLEAKSVDQKDFAVQEMISIFYKLFPPEMIGPMFEHNMRNVMLTLMADLDDPGTIIDIPRMFTDDAYVKKYLKKLDDPVVRAFWEKEMAKTSDFHKSEMLGYLISKVGRFVENEMMRNIMGQQKSGFDFREIMDKQKILLVNLAKGTTGEVNAKLIGLIIVAKLQMAAMGRADMAAEDRKDFYLYIDEFQNFVTDSIATILSEARKYKLDLIIAHQYMGQLADDKGKSPIRDAVLGNVGTMLSGRIGPDDADVLAKEFAPVFGSYDLLNPPQFSYYIKMLIDNEAAKPFNILTYPPQKGNKDLAAAIKQLARLKYGRDRRIVESEIMERTQMAEPVAKAKTDMFEASL